MSYDPFARGALPVGVCTLALADAARKSRALETELWYPAAETHAGQDLAVDTRDTYSIAPAMPTNWQRAVRGAEPRGGQYPLVLFSHGFGGHRRQATFLCTHLASHGYVVASADHAGNTFLDLVERMTSRPPADAPPRRSMLEETMEDRPRDIGFLLDALLAGAEGAPAAVNVDPARIGISGHSMGGWTALASLAGERRLRAAALLAPAGGAHKLRGEIDFDWGRPVPTLFMAAEGDSILALPALRQLYDDAPAPKTIIVIENADHMHFADASKRVHEMLRRMPGVDKALQPHKPLPPFDELCSASAVHEVARGLALAHFDAELSGHVEAHSLLGGDLSALLTRCGLVGEVA